MKVFSLLVACCLTVLFDVADESQHRRYAGRGAEPARPRRTEPPGPRLRRRALRRGRPRLPRLLRPEDGGAGRKRTRVRRLPHGHRQFPALARERRGEVQAASAAAAVQSRCRRSAVSAGRRGRFPHQWRQCQRFQQSAAERSRQDHLSAAAEYEADRSGDERGLRRDVRGRVAERAHGQ